MSTPGFYSTGSWVPFADQEEQFLDAWIDFARWAAASPGSVGDAVLVRDLRETTRFISMLPWESLEAIKSWKTHPEFKERMSQVQQHVDKFVPTETAVVAHVSSGS